MEPVVVHELKNIMEIKLSDIFVPMLGRPWLPLLSLSEMISAVGGMVRLGR